MRQYLVTKTRFALMLIVAWSSVLNASSEIKIALGEWPPYSSQNLPHGGLLPLIIKRAFAYSKPDTSLHFKYMSWDQAYNKTLEGHFDLSPGWLKTPDREAAMNFSAPVSFINLRFLHRSEQDVSWEHLEDLYTANKLGVVPGYSYSEQLDDAIRNKRFQTKALKSDLDAIQAIISKSIDLYPVDSLVATYLLNKLPEKQQPLVSLDEHTIGYNPIYLINSKLQDKELLNAFNKGLEQLKQSGEYKKILSNIGLINRIGDLNFYTEDNAPMNYQTREGAAGIMVAAIKAILREIGADQERVNIQVQPWARAYKNLETSKNVALFAITKTEQRSELFQWVGPVYRSNIIILGLKSKFPTTPKLQDLLALDTCAVIDDVGEQLWKLNSPPNDKVHLVSHPKQCANMLNLGRVDLWVTGKDSARWHIRNNQLDADNFKEVGQLKEAFRYIAFSQDVDSDIIDTFQQTLNYLQLSGKVVELIKHELQKAEQYASETIQPKMIAPRSKQSSQ